MQSPTRSPKRQTIVQSPLNVTKFSEVIVAKRENAELHNDLLKTQAQNEDLKNILISLENKLFVMTELKQDLQRHKEMLAKNEAARTLSLQQELQRTAIKVAEDAASHNTF